MGFGPQAALVRGPCHQVLHLGDKSELGVQQSLLSCLGTGQGLSRTLMSSTTWILSTSGRSKINGNAFHRAGLRSTVLAIIHYAMINQFIGWWRPTERGARAPVSRDRGLLTTRHLQTGRCLDQRHREYK